MCIKIVCVCVSGKELPLFCDVDLNETPRVQISAQSENSLSGICRYWLHIGIMTHTKRQQSIKKLKSKLLYFFISLVKSKLDRFNRVRLNKI